jgi:hypothetical protein
MLTTGDIHLVASGDSRLAANPRCRPAQLRAAPIIDVHGAVPAATVVTPGRMVIAPGDLHVPHAGRLTGGTATARFPATPIRRPDRRG